LQPLAREINFSETVFVYPAAGDGHARIRIFTPALELPFAGHPVLGTAFVLGGPLQFDELWLETGAGVVPVRLERDGSRIVFGWMRQPVVEAEGYEQAAELLSVLGVAKSGLPVELYQQGPGHVYIELDSPEAVAALKPNSDALLELGPYGTVCFARDGEGWKARAFVPAHGVAEDAATGSAAGPLALHLARHGRIGFGDEIEIHQGAEIGRPSTLFAVARSPEEVEVGGSAVVVARGEFRL
jgi:trans-2,3-dihydro-3-hydroxyanthranilate isomerase